MKKETISVKGANYEKFENNLNKKLDKYFVQLYDLIDYNPKYLTEKLIKNVRINFKKFSAIGVWTGTDFIVHHYVRYFDVSKKKYVRVLVSNLTLDDKLKLVKELSKIYIV